MQQHAVVSVSPLLNFNAFVVNMAKALDANRAQKGMSNDEFKIAYERTIDGGINNLGEATVFVVGTIFECDAWTALWCGASVPSVIGKIVESYKDNPECKSIRFVFNTGGGGISTIPELADTIFNLGKPTIAEVHENCCSAGYWLASQCDRIVATRGATIGALGVYIALMDYSKMLEKDGIKTHLISTAELKGLGEFGVGLTEAQIAFLQTYVNRSGEMFLADIKRNRPEFNVKLFTGAFWHAEDALDLGVIDDVLI